MAMGPHHLSKRRWIVFVFIIEQDKVIDWSRITKIPNCMLQIQIPGFHVKVVGFFIASNWSSWNSNPCLQTPCLSKKLPHCHHFFIISLGLSMIQRHLRIHQSHGAVAHHKRHFLKCNFQLMFQTLNFYSIQYAVAETHYVLHKSFLSILPSLSRHRIWLKTRLFSLCFLSTTGDDARARKTLFSCGASDWLLDCTLPQASRVCYCFIVRTNGLGRTKNSKNLCISFSPWT